jgi:hypothetical protein
MFAEQAIQWGGTAHAARRHGSYDVSDQKM